jgi:hypothetical protein
VRRRLATGIPVRRYCLFFAIYKAMKTPVFAASASSSAASMKGFVNSETGRLKLHFLAPH